MRLPEGPVFTQRVRSKALARNQIIEECAGMVPTHWSDPLMDRGQPARSWTDRDIEALLRGIQERVRAHKSESV